MSYRKYIEVVDPTGITRTVRPVDAREIRAAVARMEADAANSETSESNQKGKSQISSGKKQTSNVSAEVGTKSDVSNGSGKPKKKGITSRELVDTNTRQQLDSMAAMLGLEPSDYSNKKKIADAIVEATDEG